MKEFPCKINDRRRDNFSTLILPSSIIMLLLTTKNPAFSIIILNMINQNITPMEMERESSSSEDEQQSQKKSKSSNGNPIKTPAKSAKLMSTRRSSPIDKVHMVDTNTTINAEKTEVYLDSEPPDNTSMQTYNEADNVHMDDVSETESPDMSHVTSKYVISIDGPLMSMFCKDTFINTVADHVTGGLYFNDDTISDHLQNGLYFRTYNEADNVHMTEKDRFLEVEKIVNFLAEIGHHIQHSGASMHTRTRSQSKISPENIFVNALLDNVISANDEFLDCFPPPMKIYHDNLSTEQIFALYKIPNVALLPEAVESFFYFCNRYHRHLKRERLIETDCNVFIMSSDSDPFINQTCMSILDGDKIANNLWDYDLSQLKSNIAFMDHMAGENISSADVLLIHRSVLLNAGNKTMAATFNKAAKCGAVTHYITVGVCKTTSRVIVYDSMSGTSQEKLKHYEITCKEALAYFRLEHSRANNAEETIAWEKFEPYTYKLFPQQTPGSDDCGVYAAYSALCHAYGLKPMLGQNLKKGNNDSLPDDFVQKFRMAMFTVICFKSYFGCKT